MSDPELDSFQAITLATFNPASLTGSFQPLNGSGFSDNIKILKIYNGSGTGIDISFDGVKPHDFWPAGATIIIDFQTNHNDSPPYGSGTLYGRAGQIIYGRISANPTFIQIAGFR